MAAVDNALTGFRQAARQLTITASESLDVLASETAFERLYHQFNVLPDGVAFNPFDRNTMSWPNLMPSDIMASGDADEAIETVRQNAQAFYQRCMDAARRNHSNGTRHVRVVGTTQHVQETSLPRSSDASQRDRNVHASISTGSGKTHDRPQVVIREVGNTGQATVHNATNTPHGTANRSHGSALTVPGTNTLHDASVMLISSLGAIDRYADAVLTQRNTANSGNDTQLNQAATGGFPRKTSQSDTVIDAVNAAMHPQMPTANHLASTASVQTDAALNHHPALLSAVACIAHMLERPNTGKTRIVEPSTASSGVTGKVLEHAPAQLQPHTFSAKVQNTVGGSGNRMDNAVGGAASVPVSFNKPGGMLSALEPDRLAEKVDQALREQAWLNGVDLS